MHQFGWYRRLCLVPYWDGTIFFAPPKKGEKMKKMKKILCVMMAAVLALGLCACGKEESKDKDTYKIGIIQYVSHPSLDNCYNGIMNAINASDNADKITVDRQIGSDSAADSDCATYAANMVSQEYDMIIAIATPAASAAFAATEGTDIPVIFCAVSDPVAVELVESMDNPGELCTGTSDVLDMEAHVDMIQAFLPDVKTIGVVYTTSEANSITQLGNLKTVCDARGLTVEAVGIQNDADIPAAAQALAEKADCFLNFTDNKVVNNLSVLLEAANAAGIPVFGSEEEQVKNGCAASMSIDYVALGEITGEMALDVMIDGADAKTMAVKTTSDATPVINSKVLSDLNISVPDNYKDAVDVAE